MSDQAVLDPNQVWQRLVESYMAYCRASKEFSTLDRVSLVRRHLFAPNGADRATAIQMMRGLTIGEQTNLFSELIRLARSAHGPVGLVRQIILGLPREWVLEHIEPEVNRILQGEEYDDYWMFLELYELLDQQLTLALARRAAAHPDVEIREKGVEFLERLAPAEKTPPTINV